MKLENIYYKIPNHSQDVKLVCDYIWSGVMAHGSMHVTK